MTVDARVKGLHYNAATERQEASFDFAVAPRPNAMETHCIWYVDGETKSEYFGETEANFTLTTTG